MLFSSSDHYVPSRSSLASRSANRQMPTASNARSTSGAGIQGTKIPANIRRPRQKLQDFDSGGSACSPNDQGRLHAIKRLARSHPTRPERREGKYVKTWLWKAMLPAAVFLPALGGAAPLLRHLHVLNRYLTTTTAARRLRSHPFTPAN